MSKQQGFNWQAAIAISMATSSYQKIVAKKKKKKSLVKPNCAMPSSTQEEKYNERVRLS